MDHRITALSVQKRNPQRINVYLDGEYAFGLARIVAAWLQVGQVISESKIEQLRKQDEGEVAYLQALRILEYRPRSEAEIQQRLSRKGASEEIIQATIERLRRNGLVNDESFAQVWVENRSEFRPRSRRALAYELGRRGVERQVVEAALEDTDDEALAYQAALKHAGKLKGLDWQAFRQKMYAFLGRRGFSYEVSAPVVARIWADMNDDDNEADR